MASSFVSTPHALGTGNAADEGNYIDQSSDDTERALELSHGFSIADFAAVVPAVTYTVTSMTHAGLAYTINQASINGGGIVQIPAGTITISSTFYIPSNVLVEGAGIGSTRLQFAGSRRMLWLKNVGNVVLRDMTIDGRNIASVCVSMTHCTNVLLERLDVLRASGPAVRCEHVEDFTLRYSTVRDSYHGFGLKDCEETDGQNMSATTSFCHSQYLADWAGTYGSEWSTSLSVYSNTFSGNKVHGFNCHGENGEYCGNEMINNGYGGKTIDADSILFHHNVISGNPGWGMVIGQSINVSGRYANDIIYAKNRFFNNGGADFAIYQNEDLDPITVEEIYLISNEYDSTAQISNHVATATDWFMCSGSDDEDVTLSLKSPGTAPGTAGVGDCVDYETGAGSVGAINAAFTIDSDTGAAPHVATFTDTSTADNTITAWQWSYNLDGAGWINFSTAEDPTWIFAQVGTYTVRLTVTSSDGNDSATDTVTVTGTETGSYGSELLTNGDFATNDLTGWTFSVGGGSGSASGATGAAVVTLTAGSSTTELYQSGITVTSGDQYRIQVKLNTASGTPYVNVLVKQTGGSQLNISYNVQQINSTQSLYTYEFTATRDGPAKVGIVFNQAGAFTYTVDDFSFKKYTAGSATGDPCDSTLLTNGDFSSSLATGWSTYTNGTATFAVVSGAAVATITNGSTNTQLYQSGFALTAATEYVLRLTISANENCSVTVRVIKHASPYTVEFSETVGVTTASQDLEYRFTPGTTHASARLQIQFNGLSNKTVTIDDVCVAEWFEPYQPSDNTTLLKAFDQPLRSGLAW